MGSNIWFALTGAGALEVIVRGTVMYIVLLAFLRFGLKRRIGGLGISDLLVIVLMGGPFTTEVFSTRNAWQNKHRWFTVRGISERSQYTLHEEQ